MLKPFRTLLLTAVLCTAVFAEAPTSAPVNTAVIPALQPRFEAKHAKNVEIAKQGDIDLLFMGDSITDFWRQEKPPQRKPATGQTEAPPPIPGDRVGKPVFDQYFGQMKVANFGISGDTTQGVLFRLQNGEGQGFSPKAIMLMIGTNNTRANTAEEIADGVKAIVEEMRKDFPNAKILLLAIFPRNNPPEAKEKIDAINKIIAGLDDQQHVFFMDIGKQFLGPDGTVPKDIMADGLHPTTKGYEIWAKAVIEPLKKLMQ